MMPSYSWSVALPRLLASRVVRAKPQQQPLSVTSSRKLDIKVWVGGNIGNPLIEDLDEISRDDIVVMELSSFQLDLMTVSPQVAAILNLTPNHLDRHGTMENYVNAKANIIRYQTPSDVAVLGTDDQIVGQLVGIVEGELSIIQSL